MYVTLNVINVTHVPNEYEALLTFNEFRFEVPSPRIEYGVMVELTPRCTIFDVGLPPAYYWYIIISVEK